VHTIERPGHLAFVLDRWIVAAGACLMTITVSPARAQQSGPGGPTVLPAPTPAELASPAGQSEVSPPGTAAQAEVAAIAEQPAPKPAWYFSPILRVLETATDNGAYGGTTATRTSDLISDLSAGFTIAGRTPRLEIQGGYSLRTLDYARGSQSGQVIPSGALNGQLEAIERHLFIDAAVMSQRILTNPLSPVPSTESTLNNSTFNVERIAPHFQGQFGRTVQFRLRSDNGWTQTTPSNELQPNTYLGNHTADIEQVPAPVGLALNAQRQETDFRSFSVHNITEESARAILRATPWPGFTAGLRYGIESNDFGRSPDDRVAHFAGADLSWHPTSRTEAEGFVERRLFGHRWYFRADHRTPLFAFNLTTNRATTTSPMALLGIAGTADVASLLDAIYTTRYPDPIERARIVNELMVSEGLPTTLVTPLGTLTPNAVRIKDDRFTVVARGHRSTAALALYAHRNETLRANVSAPPPVVTTVIDSFQIIGASASYSLRLTRTTTSTLLAATNRSTGIRPFEGDQTTETAYTLSFSEAISRHLDAVAGAGHRSAHSNVVISGEETYIFTGLACRL